MHDPKVAQRILDILMEKGDTEENLKIAWEQVVKLLL
jgi:hypothetical protein